jgi:hypothetical protein
MVTMSGLRSLSLCVGRGLTPRVIATIASFPGLDDFRVQLDGMDASAFAEALREASPDPTSGTLFPALQTLHVRSSPTVAATLFRSLPHNTTLHTLHLESDFKPRPIDEWTPVFALLGVKAAHSLRRLSVESLTTFCEAPDHNFPPKLHFTRDTLSPLAALTHLQRFRLDPAVPPDLSDADIEVVAGWWPEIEELELWSRPIDAFDSAAYFSSQPCATLASLAVLAAQCSRLRILALPMNLSRFPAPSPSLNGVLHRRGTLESLTIGCTNQAGQSLRPLQLAECIYDAFPGLKGLEFDCNDETAWIGVINIYRGLQKRVDYRIPI